MEYEPDTTPDTCAVREFSVKTLPRCPILSTLPYGVIVHDLSGTILMANQAAGAILGVRLDQMQGRTSSDPLWHCIHEDGSDYPGETHPGMVVLTTRQPMRGVIMGVHHSQRGEYVWIEIDASPLFGPDGQIEGSYTTFSDISDRVRHEALVREGWLALDAIQDLVAVLDDEHCYRIVNKAFLAQRDAGMTDIIGRHAREVLGAEVYDGTIRQKLEACLQGERITFEMEMDYPHLGHRFLVVRYVPFKRPGMGNIDRVVCTITDVTESRQAELFARENERYLRTIIETTADGFWVLDSAGRFVDVNEAYCRMIGFTREEILTFSIPDIDVDENLALAHERIMRVIQTGHERFTTRHRRKDGSVFLAEISTTYMGPEVGRFVCFCHDITEEVHARHAIQHSHEMLQIIIEHMRSAVAIFDRDMHYLYVSQRYLKEYGIEGLNLIGRSHYDVFPDIPEKWKEVHRQVLAGAVLRNDNDHYERADGALLLTEWECRPWHQADGTIGGLVLYTEVVTNKRRAEAERRLLEAKLRNEQKLSSIGTMASGVAHEINNPLMGIINLAQLVEDRAPEEAESIKNYAREIRNEGERIAEIVSSLLTFSRRDEGRMEHVGPADLLDRVLALCETLLLRQDITIEKRIAPDLPSVVCSQSQIQQILLNLIINARDAVNERYHGAGPDKRITVWLGLHESSSGRYVRYSIVDQGSGIPPEIASRIFEPFFTTKPQGAGTGIGLSISYGIARAHRGDLSFENRPEGGTVFHLDLPLEVQAD